MVIVLRGRVEASEEVEEVVVAVVELKANMYELASAFEQQHSRYYLGVCVSACGSVVLHSWGAGVSTASPRLPMQTSTHLCRHVMHLPTFLSMLCVVCVVVMLLHFER
jgi:hypothetical protein